MALKALYEKEIPTPVKVTLRFKNFYLYSSVNSADGTSFTLLLPSANTDCMNIFLEELSTINQEDFILIMEGAVCHKSRIFIRLKWFWYSFLENTFALKQALYKLVVVPRNKMMVGDP